MALGAAYAAPYLGRMDESGRDGHGTVISMQRMIRAMESPMRLLVASLRRVESIPALIEQGVDVGRRRLGRLSGRRLSGVA